MLALITAAAAHVPHEKVVFAAVGEDLSGPACVVLDPWASDVLACSDSEDRWSHLGGDPLADDLLAGAVLGDGALILAARQRLWSSSDAGATWSGADLAFAVTTLVIADDALWLGTTDGVRTGPPGGPFTASLTGLEVTALATSPWGIAALAGGSAWSNAGSGWLDAGSPATDPVSVVAGADAVYVGTAGGGVWRSGADGWTPCGALPTPEPTDRTWHPDVTRLAADGAALLAATAWRGPFVSDDGCATWTDRHAPLDTEYDDDGHAESTAEAVTGLYAADGVWLMAGWGGMARSADGGVTWASPLLLPPDFIRGLAVSPDFARDGTVYIGGYAAGVERSFDGGTTFDAPSLGLGLPNVQSLVVTGTGGDQLVMTVGGHHAWVSGDLGEHWIVAGSPYENDARALFVGGPDRWWVAGYAYGDRAAGISESTDRGATWTPLDGLLAALGGRMPEFVASASGELCVAAASVACSRDDGTSWETRWEPGVTVRALVGWPAAAPTRLVAALGDRVEVSDDGGRTWIAGLETGLDGPIFLAVADDGTIWAATDTARLLRSDDGGSSWEDAGVRVPGTVLALAARPGSDRELFVGASDGTFRLTSDGALVRWATYQRVDDTHSEYVVCEGCTTEPRSTAALGTVTRLPAGAELSLRLRGTYVAILGTSDGDSAVSVWIDGEERASFGGDAVSRIGRLVGVDGLPDGLHDVRLVGVRGDGVRLDGFESYAEAPPQAAAIPAARCGCGDGRSTLGLLLLAGLRRRARPSNRRERVADVAGRG